MERYRITNMRLLLFISLLILFVYMLTPQAGFAQYPTKPIMFMAPSGAGGGWDTTARSVSVVLQQEKIISQPLQVFNREGGSGAVGLSELVHQNRKNPYMIMVTSAPIILNELLGISQEGYKDVVPIANLITDYVILVVREDSKFKTLKDLTEALKRDSTSVKMGTGGMRASAIGVALMYVLSAAGIDINLPLTVVSFQGDGKALAGLMGGHVDVIAVTLGSSSSYLEAKKIRAIAVTSERRLEGSISKNIPTAKEQGANAVYPWWRGIVGPPEMPDYVVKFLENALEKMVKTKSWQEMLNKNEWIDYFSGASDFKRFLDGDFEKNKILCEKMGLIKSKK